MLLARTLPTELLAQQATVTQITFTAQGRLNVALWIAVFLVAYQRYRRELMASS